MAPNTLSGEGPALALHLNLDFGTTRSAVTWGFSSQSDTQETILEWVGPDGNIDAATVPKIPTEIAYIDGKPVWGGQIPESEPRHQCFKLGLCPDQRQHASYLEIKHPDVKALPPTTGRSDGDLSTDYMKCIRKHAISILKKKPGEATVRTTQIIWPITIPAIWSDAGKKKTQICARDAGMGENVHTISEPEAAAVYCIVSMKDTLRLKIGDRLVVESLEGKLVKLKEAAAGDGHACGGVFLNRKFQKWIVENFSTHSGWDSDTLEAAMDSFEMKVKRNFRESKGDSIVDVPGLKDDPSKRIRRGKLAISSAVMQTIFEPIISVITALVSAQLKASNGATAVLLVGGFGQSNHLEECIRQVIGKGTALWKPAKGEEAVIRGSLILSVAHSAPEALTLQITSRVARRAYGIEAGFEWVQSDRTGGIYWDDCDGLWRIDNMDWAVKKGSQVKETEPVVLHFTQTSPRYRTMQSFCVDVLVYDGVEHAPIYADQGTRKLVVLRADLSRVARRDMPTKVGEDGKIYYKLDFEVHVTFYAAITKYELWYRDRCYGSVDAEYA